MLLLLAPFASAQAPAAAPKPIGVIVDFKDGGAESPKMSVEYSYGADSQLILVVRGVEMNGAAHTNPGKAVVGELLVQGNQIKIRPDEIYGEKGAVETTRDYTIRYIVPKLAPGTYRFIHDDSLTEGADRVIDISLDLRKPVKKTLAVEGKPAPRPAAPASAP